MLLLNKADPAINQVVNHINAFLASTSTVEGEYILEALKKGKDIAASYNIKPNKSSNEPIINLPDLFFNAFEELDNVIETAKLMTKLSPQNKQARVKERLAKYVKAINGLRN